MTFECSNSLYGTTKNPHDPTRIPGGSSGGESALIGGGGSILGMGGDIGGSLRIPAHMAGCCSLKPSGGRIRLISFALSRMKYSQTYLKVIYLKPKTCLVRSSCPTVVTSMYLEPHFKVTLSNCSNIYVFRTSFQGHPVQL